MWAISSAAGAIRLAQSVRYHRCIVLRTGNWRAWSLNTQSYKQTGSVYRKSEEGGSSVGCRPGTDKTRAMAVRGGSSPHRSTRWCDCEPYEIVMAALAKCIDCWAEIFPAQTECKEKMHLERLYQRDERADEVDFIHDKQ
jgi:hypothetical protein